MREREGLIARIRQIRRTAVTPVPPQAKVEPIDVGLHGLQARVEHLEQLLEALQDSVHRESARHERMIAELEARIQPAALGVALTQDARERGL